MPRRKASVAALPDPVTPLPRRRKRAQTAYRSPTARIHSTIRPAGLQAPGPPCPREDGEPRQK